uniref:Uncharacterized protein n=1 Tax=Rhodnius prolixus TaxID=13249 RepID=T1I493_RHOPR
MEDTPSMSMLSGGDADLKAIKCRYLIDRLDRWTQNAKTLDTDVPEIVTTCQRLSSGFLALSQTVDGEVWEWLRALVPEERGPLARALTKSFAQAELVHLSRIAPILDSSISFCASAPPGPVSQVLVSDESVVELARRQLQELVIPKITPFEGDVLAYQEFKRTFQFEINKLSLPPHRRLQALKSCLKGPPLSIIQNSTPTEEGYSSAWETLDARYEVALCPRSAGCLECAGAHHTTLHPPPPSSSLSQRTLPDVVIPPLMSLSPKLTKKLPDPSPRRAVPHLRDDVSYPSTSSGSSTLSSLPTIYFGSDSPKATF